MNRYVLSGDRLKSDHHHEVISVRELMPEEFERYSAANDALWRFTASHNLYAIIEINYDELADYYEEAREYQHEHGISLEYGSHVGLEMNRRLVNYLTSFRTFNYHQETLFKRLDSQGTNFLVSFMSERAFIMIIALHIDSCGGSATMFNIAAYQ